MKTSKVFIAAMATLVLGACSSTDKASQLHNECIFPNSDGQLAPGWICDEPTGTTYRQAYGYSRQLAAGHGMMRSVAETEARAALARQFLTEVTSELKRYSGDYFSSETEVAQSHDQIELYMENFTSMEMMNALVIRSQPAPDGGLYVLVGISEEDYAKNLQRISQSMPSEADIYRRFLLEEARTRISTQGE